MSKYHFEYTIISKTGAKEDRIKFFFARSYDTLGMKIQVCIPEEMYQNFKAVRVRYAYNASVLPETLITSEEVSKKSVIIRFPRTYRDRTDDSIEFLHDINGIFISADQDSFSCTGDLAFCKTENIDEIVPDENVYQFVINFAEKEAIHYQIREINRNDKRRDRLEISILYPRLNKDIELQLLSKEGTKPILRKDILNGRVIDVERTSKKRLVLKKFKRDMSLAVFVVSPGEDVFTHNYRLGFANPEECEPFYYLSDESQFTTEDFEERKKQLAQEAKRRKEKLTIRCPYCGFPVAQSAIAAKTGVYMCDGTPINNLTIPLSKKKTIQKVICCGTQRSITLSQQSGNAIPVDHPILPNHYCEKPALNVVVAGFQNCGKTTFLASLFDMERRSQESFVAHAPILQEITKKFTPKKKESSVREIEMISIPNEDIKPENPVHDYSVSWDYENARNRIIRVGEFQPVSVKGRFCFEVNKNFESNTNEDDEKVLSWNPIGFELGALGYLYFYDVPGEKFSKDNVKVRCVDMADSFIILVDGDPLILTDERKKTSEIMETALKDPLLDNSLRLLFQNYLDIENGKRDPNDRDRVGQNIIAYLRREHKQRPEDDLLGYENYLRTGRNRERTIEESPLKRLQLTVTQLAKLRDPSSKINQKPLKECPVAIVFSKLDYRLYSHDAIHLEMGDHCFDSNCHITHENMVPLYPKNRRYRGSEIEKHINNASYELEQYLKSLTDGEATIKDIKKMFENVKFFACSALGGSDVLENAQRNVRNKKIMYRPRPIRMELPIIWLLAENGIIKE